jgi:membrane protease YdiL (CAAX protease family)
MAVVGLYLLVAAQIGEWMPALEPLLGSAAASMPVVLLLGEVPLAVGGVLLSVLFWRGVDRRPAGELGLRLPRRGEWAAGLALGLTPMLLGLPVALGTGHVRFAGLISGSVEVLIGRVAVLAALGLLIGIAEEAPFRGYLLMNAIERLPRPVGAFAVSFLFATLHLLEPSNQQPLNVVSLTLAGIGFALLRLGSGSLVLPMLVHAVYDLAFFLAGMDPDLPGLVRAEIGPDDLWLGGVKRAGLVDVVVAGVWIGVIWWAVYAPGVRRAVGGRDVGPPRR